MEKQMWKANLMNILTRLHRLNDHIYTMYHWLSKSSDLYDYDVKMGFSPTLYPFAARLFVYIIRDSILTLALIQGKDRKEQLLEFIKEFQDLIYKHTKHNVVLV